MIEQEFTDMSFERLTAAIEHSRMALQPFRETRADLIRNYVGSHYGNEGSTEKVPVNFVEMAINIFCRQAAAQNPKVIGSSPHRILRPVANSLERVINVHIARTKFDEELRGVVRDAIFLMGIMHVGLKSGSPGGVPFARRVSLNDFVVDMTATTWDEIDYIGHKFRMPLRLAKSNQYFDEEARNQLFATEREPINPEGDEKASAIGHGEWMQPDELQDYVELWQVYLPKMGESGSVVTFPVEDGGDRILRAVNWNGPRHGPYHILSFAEVPDNLMPLSPVMIWFDLHDLANRLWRKVGRQAERQKTVNLVQNSAMKDGEKHRDAEDGAYIPVDDVTKFNAIKSGGADPTTLGAFLQTKELINWVAGNLDVLGGLGPQADTATQEQILNKNSGNRIADMQSRVYTFTRGCVEDLGWLLWTDPVTAYQVVKTIPGTDISIVSYLTPQQRSGSLTDFEISLEPYSLQPQSPEQRLQIVMMLYERLVLPSLPIMAQQGIAIDMQRFLRHVAKLAHSDVFDDILIYQQPIPIPGDPGSMQMRPPNTQHTNVRINRPGTTRRASDGVMERLLAGIGTQPAEAAAAARSPG